jgi:hypothetical protein
LCGKVFGYRVAETLAVELEVSMLYVVTSTQIGKGKGKSRRIGLGKAKETAKETQG